MSVIGGEMLVNGFLLPTGVFEKVDLWLLKQMIYEGDFENVYLSWLSIKDKFGMFYANEILEYAFSEVYGFGDVVDYYYNEYVECVKKITGGK